MERFLNLRLALLAKGYQGIRIAAAGGQKIEKNLSARIELGRNSPSGSSSVRLRTGAEHIGDFATALVCLIFLGRNFKIFLSETSSRFKSPGTE